MVIPVPALLKGQSELHFVSGIMCLDKTRQGQGANAAFRGTLGHGALELSKQRQLAWESLVPRKHQYLLTAYNCLLKQLKMCNHDLNRLERIPGEDLIALRSNPLTK